MCFRTKFCPFESHRFSSRSWEPARPKVHLNNSMSSKHAKALEFPEEEEENILHKLAYGGAPEELLSMVVEHAGFWWKENKKTEKEKGKAFRRIFNSTTTIAAEDWRSMSVLLCDRSLLSGGCVSKRFRQAMQLACKNNPELLARALMQVSS